MKAKMLRNLDWVIAPSRNDHCEVVRVDFIGNAKANGAPSIHC